MLQAKLEEEKSAFLRLIKQNNLHFYHEGISFHFFLPGQLICGGGESYKEQFNPKHTEADTAVLGRICSI